MAKQEILISINLRGAGEASDGVNKLRRDYSKLTDEELKLLKVERERVLQNRDIVAGIDQEIIATNAKANATKAARTQAGLNNAILLETGRLASDASYGFTAMANNLSQITSLFGSFIQTNDGVIKSFKQLGKSLMGTGGVLLLIQLFIAALQSERVKEFINSLQGLSKAMQLVKDSFDEANDEYGKQLGFLRTMQTLLNDTNVSQKQKAVILNRVKKEHDELNPKLDEEGKLTEDSTAKMEEYLVVLEKKAKSQALMNTIQEEYVKLQKLEDSTADENIGTLDVLKDKFNQLIKGQSAFTVSTELLTTGEEKRQEAIDESKKTIEELTEKLKELGIFSTEEEGDDRARSFKQQLLNLEKLEESYRQKSIDTAMKTREEIIDIEEQNAIRELDIRRDAFIKKQKLRLEEFKESKASPAEIAKAEKEVNDSIEKAQQEHGEVMIQLTSSFQTKRNQLIRKKREEARAEQEKVDELEEQKLDAQAANLDAIDAMGVKQAFNTRARNLERLAEDKKLAERNAEVAEEGTERKAQAELALLELKKQIALEERALEQDKFDFINEQYTSITNTLSETFSVSAKNETIALEESYGRRIAAAEGDKEAQERLQEELAEKKDKIARKQFKIDKAMKIGRALMDTYQSAFLAFGSQLVVGDPTSPVRARIAQAVALASGLANVANIARQKYQSSLGAGGGGGASGGGGGMQIQAPDFNVVGASQQSQLAQAVSTAQQQPVKAFVVGKDISTQQELDRNITNTASFG